MTGRSAQDLLFLSVHCAAGISSVFQHRNNSYPHVEKLLLGTKHSIYQHGFQGVFPHLCITVEKSQIVLISSTFLSTDHCGKGVDKLIFSTFSTRYPHVKTFSTIFSTFEFCGKQWKTCEFLYIQHLFSPHMLWRKFFSTF